MKKLVFLFLWFPFFLNAANYTWNSRVDNILIDNLVFGPLQAGDTVFIPARPGGYKGQNYDRLQSGANYTQLASGNGYIVIYFMPGAYMAPSAGDDYNSFMDNCVGLKIYGLFMRDCVNVFFRLGNSRYGPQGGKPHGYSSWICIDSATFINSSAIHTEVTGLLQRFAGDTNNMYHHWWIRNCLFDSAGGGEYGGITAIQIGGAYSTSTDNFWRDLEISGCVFDHYSSGTTTPSVYINLMNVWGAKIHNNRFSNLGMVKHPAGHASVINMDIGGQVYVYNNTFGPNNFGNDVRMKGASLQLAGWNNRCRFYNNIIFDKRKYPVVENQQVSKDLLSLLSPYVIARSGPEVYNNTVYNLSAGSGNTPYIVALYDNYTNDTVTVKNNVLIQVKDTNWATANPRIVAFSYGKPAFVDAAGNKSVSLFKNAGIINTTTWVPVKNGILYKTGVKVPKWLTTDFYGKPRSSGGYPDIGAVENTIPAQPPKSKKEKI